MIAPRSILISRTDSIGDVVLTLPLAKVLKEEFPQARVGFLGRNYTKPVIDACENIDEFLLAHDFIAGRASAGATQWDCIIHVFPNAAIASQAKALGIPIRIGTTNRLYHWNTCNKLVRLSRKNSPFHEAQLNFALLKPLGIVWRPSLEELGTMYSLTRLEELERDWKQMLFPNKFRLILHPKSQGSAREWGFENFGALIDLLPPEQYEIFISGTEGERNSLLPLLKKYQGRVVDLVGMMDLSQFISFIAHCDGLVAASTGPLHIAAALGKKAIGIYPPIRPMHPGRWAPLGPSAIALSLEQSCSDCRKNAGACHCMKEIQPARVSCLLEGN